MAETTKTGGFTPEERAAMKQRAKEVKENATKDEALREVLAKIAELEPEDRTRAERIHSIVTETAPQLAPRLWYGSPAYAKDGRIVCFFQESTKFTTRYGTLGFSDSANLDDGSMWPTSYAILTLTADDEKKIAELVRKAAG